MCFPSLRCQLVMEEPQLNGTLHAVIRLKLAEYCHKKLNLRHQVYILC